MHLEKIIEKMVSDDMDVYIMGDFNKALLKCESSQISQDFLLSSKLLSYSNSGKTNASS